MTRGSRAWSVLLAIVVLTKLLGCRRVVCANYVIADTALAVERADLFSANQILHLRPLADAALLRDFVAANPFVADYYPGERAAGRALPGFAPGPIVAALKRAAEWVLAWGPGWAIESASRAVYSRYLRSRARRWASPDQVELSGNHLKLHTMSHRRAVLDRFEAKVRQTAAVTRPARRRAGLSARG